MAEGAVSVTRPGRFGNPYKVEVYGLDLALTLFDNTARGYWNPTILAHLSDDEFRETYALHRAWIAQLGGNPIEVIRNELAGRDLACWCALPEPGQPDRCHASTTLLPLANPTRED